MLQRGSLRRLVSIQLKSIEDLFHGHLRKCPTSVLLPGDYKHVATKLELVCRLMSEAIETRRAGVNILICGLPGTGKTQLVRVVADRLNVPLYEMSLTDGTGDPESAEMYLKKTATCQQLLSGQKALPAFDECDTVFNPGTAPSGNTVAGAMKAWVNDLLESNTVPMFWVANQIGGMDPAFVRRFDLVFRLGKPPVQHRLNLLVREYGDEIPPAQLQRLANVNAATPGVLARAINVTQRIHGPRQKQGDVLESLLDETLRAQGYPPIRATHHRSCVLDYDVNLCNANVDLGRLAEGLQKSNLGRVLLYGPPGSGKTAFGHWLSDTLSKPLVLKRMSDIQSPLLGEMEKRLARAFEEALQDDAILQIDEVDSFLRDRSIARHSWEVTQVNEFLTQMESYDGIFIASTNLMNDLDQAALRRFDYKVQVNYLRADQVWQMFLRRVYDWALSMTGMETCRQQLSNLVHLTPGDFMVLDRLHSVIPFQNSIAVIEALIGEVALKPSGRRRMGFL